MKTLLLHDGHGQVLARIRFRRFSAGLKRAAKVVAKGFPRIGVLDRCADGAYHIQFARQQADGTLALSPRFAVTVERPQIS